jgi:hypothetical protein
MSKTKGSARRERTPFEWAVLATSLTAIAAIAAGLIAFGVTAESTPPELKLSLEPESGSTVAFTLTVDNLGGSTATDVVVLVKRGDDEHEVHFRAIPKRDTEEATVSLEGDGEPSARVLSYTEP